MKGVEMFRQLATLGPLLFGVGFLAPLIAQSMEALSISAPLGVSNIVLGLVAGSTLGVIASWRGRWV